MGIYSPQVNDEVYSPVSEDFQSLHAFALCARGALSPVRRSPPMKRHHTGDRGLAYKHGSFLPL